MSINITDAIFAQAEQYPDGLAVIDAKISLTYRALSHAVGLAARRFLQAGWKAGDIVGISPGHDPALHLVSVLALARIGVTQVPVPPGDSILLREERVRRLGITGLVVTKRHTAAKINVAVTAPDSAWLEPQSTVSIEDLRAPGGETPWIIVETSGTTATPKAIGISHASENAHHTRLAPILRCMQGERFLSMTSLNFLSALKRTVYCLSEGGVVTFPPTNFPAAHLLQWIQQQGIAYMSCVPLHLFGFLQSIKEDVPHLPLLRVLRCSTAALPVSAVRDVRKRISPNLFIDYGCTEIGTAAVATPTMLEQNPATVGRLLAGVELQVVDNTDRPVASGVSGHVRVRGSGIGSCYLHAAEPGQTSAFRDGWFYPGDVAVIDSDGLVYLKGRSDEVMNFDGILVGPNEIESVLREHPAVDEVAAFALPSMEHQDIPAAAIVSHVPLPLRDLQRFCAERLGIRSPRVFLPFDSIPKNPMGKVLRRRVTELALQKLGKQPRS